MADERAQRCDRRRHRRVLVALLVALLVASTLAAGCRQLPPPLRARALRDCPGPLVATDAIAGDFLVRQRVLVTAGGTSWPLQLVAQKRGDVLTLLGFHPLGVKLFTLQQRGLRVTVDAAPAPLLEIPPRNLLRDFHRERFFVVADAGAEGTFRERRGDTEIREQRRAGRVVERRFVAIAGDPSAAVVLRFEPAAAADGEAPRVVLDHGACGYRAEITTLSETEMP